MIALDFFARRPSDFGLLSYTKQHWAGVSRLPHEGPHGLESTHQRVTGRGCVGPGVRG